MKKNLSQREKIENQRDEISAQLSGTDTVKRLNNLNWLRHEITYAEPMTLIPSDVRNLKDYTNMTNIGTAYDYILNNAATTPITPEGIRKIHEILCEGTNIDGGQLRTTSKIIEIMVNGQRMHAPDAYEVEYLLNDIVYKLNASKSSTLDCAFQIHYDLIALQPFNDFNKRTARMIMNWILIRGGYRPIVFNKRGDKDAYRNAIAAMAAGNRKEYITYMKDVMLRTQREILKQLKKSHL